MDSTERKLGLWEVVTYFKIYIYIADTFHDKFYIHINTGDIVRN